MNPVGAEPLPDLTLGWDPDRQLRAEPAEVFDFRGVELGTGNDLVVDASGVKGSLCSLALDAGFAYNEFQDVARLETSRCLRCVHGEIMLGSTDIPVQGTALAVRAEG